MPVVTLLTDFGLEDNFVGVMNGSPLAIFGSFGALEISINGGSAKDFFKAKAGDIVTIVSPQ